MNTRTKSSLEAKRQIKDLVEDGAPGSHLAQYTLRKTSTLHAHCQLQCVHTDIAMSAQPAPQQKVRTLRMRSMTSGTNAAMVGRNARKSPQG
jgi:hypothetical protein